MQMVIKSTNNWEWWFGDVVDRVVLPVRSLEGTFFLSFDYLLPLRFKIGVLYIPS